MSQQIIELGRMDADHLEITTNQRVFGFSKPQQFGIIAIILGTLFFRVLDDVLDYFLLKHASWPMVKTLKKKEKAEYKFKNYSLSITHSFITSTWAFLCMYVDPRLREDMINPSSTISVSLVCFSIGYFIHDLYHIISNDNYSRASLELIPHHVIVVMCFGLGIYMERYIAYAVVALLVEVNSIFLHGRQLLIIVQHPRDSTLYKTNSLLNIGTFIAFRLSTLGWMTQWLVNNGDKLPIVPYVTGSVGMFLILIINFVLFYRVVHSDFIKVRRINNNNTPSNKNNNEKD